MIDMRKLEAKAKTDTISTKDLWEKDADGASLEFSSQARLDGQVLRLMCTPNWGDASSMKLYEAKLAVQLKPVCSQRVKKVMSHSNVGKRLSQILY